MLTVGSLFSGIGGLELGLERAGMVIKWQVENDPYCIQVLRKHWPDVKRYVDITTYSPTEFERVDLICGGFPCQPVSVAGKLLYDEDDRWLWPEFLKTIRTLGPKYALIENVSGLLVRGMHGILCDLAEIGYDAEWESLPASAFGAPHRRDRVFIVAYAASTGERKESGGLRPQEGAVFNEAGIGFRDRVKPGREDVSDTSPVFGKAIKRGEPDGINGGDVADTDQPGPQGHGGFHSERDCACQFATWSCRRSHEDERLARSGIRRISHGVPKRVDRLRCLGNAVVPQVAEYIGRLIVNHSR